jgi:hypothetical protein
MTMDVWSSPTARVAATTVFALANEQPLLRPASSTAAARIAAALPIDTEQVPKAVVEEFIAGISEGEARRLPKTYPQESRWSWRPTAMGQHSSLGISSFLLTAEASRRQS